jgi:sigma-B regulation protein RsbU (phosphoserine phosphatase)
VKILFAEDDQGSRQILAAQLEKLGHEVTAVQDGEEAWKAYNSLHPELVITDRGMPNTDGLELCRLIRNSGARHYTYIIMITAMDGRTGFLEGMEAGADDFMPKPCDLLELNMRLHVAERVLQLQTQVARLEEMLPMCPTCKKVRDEENRWHPVESYLSTRTEAQFSHGVCPDCFEAIIKPQLEELKGEGK